MPKKLIEKPAKKNITINQIYRLSQTGFGIIEVMVAAGLLLIIAVGISALITNMQKEQRRQQLLQTLTMKMGQFENMIKNEAAWRYTLYGDPPLAPDNINMECLRKQKSCSNIEAPATMIPYIATTPTNLAADQFYTLAFDTIVLRDASKNIFYDGRLMAPFSGFTESGAACTGFNPSGAGNDMCPIGYRVSWRAVGTENSPQIQVVAKMIFNPTDTNPFKNFLNAPASSTTIGKYDVSILRTALSTSKAFNVGVLGPVSATGGCSTNGYGVCAVGGSWTTYQPYVVIDDPYELVSVGSAVTIKNVGSYKCTVQTSAFSVDSVSTRLYSLSPSTIEFGIKSSNANASTWTYANTTLETIMNITSKNTQIVIQQACSVRPSVAHPTAPADIDQCALGFTGTYAYSNPKNYKATLNCVLVQ